MIDIHELNQGDMVVWVSNGSEDTEEGDNNCGVVTENSYDYLKVYWFYDQQEIPYAWIWRSFITSIAKLSSVEQQKEK